MKKFITYSILFLVAYITYYLSSIFRNYIDQVFSPYQIGMEKNPTTKRLDDDKIEIEPDANNNRQLKPASHDPAKGLTELLYANINGTYSDIWIFDHITVRKLIQSEEFNLFADTLIKDLGDDAFEILLEFYKSSESTHYRSFILAIIGKSSSEASLGLLENVLHNTDSFEELTVASHVIAKFHIGNEKALNLLIDYYKSIPASSRGYLQATIESALSLCGTRAIDVLYEEASKSLEQSHNSPLSMGLFYGDLLGLTKGRDVKTRLLDIFKETKEEVIKEMCIYSMINNYGTDSINDLISISNETDDIYTNSLIFGSLWHMKEPVPEPFEKIIEDKILKFLNKTNDPDLITKFISASTATKSQLLADKIKDMLANNLIEKYGYEKGIYLKNSLLIYLSDIGMENDFLFNYINTLNGEEKIKGLINISGGDNIVDSKYLNHFKNVFNGKEINQYNVGPLIEGLAKINTTDNEKINIVVDYYDQCNNPNVRIAIVEQTTHFGTNANPFLLGIMSQDNEIPYQLAALGALLTIKENRGNKDILSQIEYDGRTLINKMFVRNSIDPTYTIYVMKNKGGLVRYSKAISDFFSLFGRTRDLALLDTIKSRMSLENMDLKMCASFNAKYSVHRGIEKARQDILLRTQSNENN